MVPFLIPFLAILLWQVRTIRRHLRIQRRLRRSLTPRARRITL